jgi:hypothetical protein
MIKNLIKECDYDNYKGEWEIKGGTLDGTVSEVTS